MFCYYLCVLDLQKTARGSQSWILFCAKRLRFTCHLQRRDTCTYARLRSFFLECVVGQGVMSDPVLHRRELWKRHICRRWEKGECPRGQTCSFAHGDAELRKPPRIVPPPAFPVRPKSGTGVQKPCFKQLFAAAKVVPPRVFVRPKFVCNTPRVVPPPPKAVTRPLPLFYKKHLCCNWKQGSCPAGESCTFAHGVEELRHPSNVFQQHQHGSASSSGTFFTDEEHLEDGSWGDAELQQTLQRSGCWCWRLVNPPPLRGEVGSGLLPDDWRMGGGRSLRTPQSPTGFTGCVGKNKQETANSKQQTRNHKQRTTTTIIAFL